MMDTWTNSTPLWIWFSGLIFAVLHSFLAARSTKDFVFRHHISEQYYRLFYSLFAMLTTAIWLAFVHALPDQPLYHLTGIAMWLALMLQAIGVVILLLTFRSFDGMMFLGLKPSTTSIDSFHISGVYRYMRHPMYTGVMLILFASPIQTMNSLHLCLAMSLYFIIGARLEEQRMRHMFPEYADYQTRVGAFIPKLGKHH